jgi:hypothetical protein
MDIVRDETYDLLIQEIEFLKESITILFMEKDELQNSTKTVLMAIYYSEIGIYELRAFELQTETLRLKRMIELFQSAINQNKSVNLEEVETQLETELNEWKEKIDSLKKNLEVSNKVLNNLVSINKEISNLYRKLSKKLHPDLNKNQNQQMESLWIRVQFAYKNADLKELELLHSLLETSNFKELKNEPFESLKTIKEGFEKKFKEIQLSIEEIESQFPFTIRGSLENPFALAELAKESKRKIFDFEKIKTKYETLLRIILLENFSTLGIHPENL